MSATINKHQPSEKGKEVIALLFPLTHKEREESIQKYWKQYPVEGEAVLDGFHFLIQELIEERGVNDSKNKIDLPEKFVFSLIKEMEEKKIFFSYENSETFLSIPIEYQPPIFADPGKIKKIHSQVLINNKKQKSIFDLPENLDDTVTLKCKEICQTAKSSFDQVRDALSVMRQTQQILKDYNNVGLDVDMKDIKDARDLLIKEKKNYKNHSRKIAEGWLYISEVFQAYFKDILILQIYPTYLSKLLASRESNYPVERYLLKIAQSDFNFSVPEFKPTELQLQHGKTRVSLANEYRALIQITIDRLECRYRKRKLMAQLKEKGSESKVIKSLVKISEIDPIDIRTHILIAKLFGKYSLITRNHQNRTIMKEQALKYCEKAFSRIDEYLDIQDIQNTRQRDQQRAGFVKTISSIRIPLIKNR